MCSARRIFLGAGGAAVGALLVAMPLFAAQKKPGPGLMKPGAGRPPSATQPAGGVQSGGLPLPDLNLSEVRIHNQVYQHKRPDGQSCYSFDLQPVFMNIGAAGTGPFKIVWERSAAVSGPFAIACPTCTQIIPDAAPNVGMLPTPRNFNNCGGYQYYRVRLDPDNAVLELLDTNNDKVVGF